MGDIGLTNSFNPVLFNVPESFTGGPSALGRSGRERCQVKTWPRAVAKREREAGSLVAAFAKRETG
jgi:hypothetical protein